MKYLTILTFVLLSSCEFETSDKGIIDRLDEFGLSLIEKPQIISNNISFTHLDHYENLELKLTESEYKNIQHQIITSRGFVNQKRYKKELDNFKSKTWTFGEIFGQDHFSKSEIITDPYAIEMAYYYKFHVGKWVERLNQYSQQLEYFKESDGIIGGEISVLQIKKLMFYYLQND